MATITAVPTDGLAGHVDRYFWETLTETNNVGSAVGVLDTPGARVQVTGTFGGATINIEGTVDGANYVTVVSFTSAGVKPVPGGYMKLRPAVSGGSSVDVDVTILAFPAPLSPQADVTGGALTVPGASAATGGIPSTARLLSAAASVNATSVKTTPARLYSIQGRVVRGTDCYLKIYDKASAPSDSDTPRKTLTLPAGAGFAFDWAVGIQLTLGLGYRITTGSADNDTGALTAGDVTGLNLDYA